MGVITMTVQIFLFGLVATCLVLAVLGVVTTTYKAEFGLQIGALVLFMWDYQRRIFYGAYGATAVVSYIFAHLLYIVVISVAIIASLRAGTKVSLKQSFSASHSRRKTCLAVKKWTLV